MLETPSEREQYLQELEDLEQKAGGVFACITPERHKKRWEQKVSHLEQRLSAATTVEEKKNLQQKLIELNRREQERSVQIAAIHALLAQSSSTTHV